MYPEREYLTVNEVAQMVGMSYFAVYRDVKAGKLPAYFKNRKWRVPRRAVAPWMEGFPSAVQTVRVSPEQVA